MAHSFVAYLDESGDDGISKFRSRGNEGCSQWLTISCLLARMTNDLDLVQWRDEISSSIPHRTKRDIHFREFNHEQKLNACQLLAQKPVRLFSVLSNKTTIPSHSRKDLFKEKNTLYWYLCRHLIERISWACRDLRSRVSQGDGRVRIIFSRRGGLTYLDFQNYLTLIKHRHESGEEENNIHWPVIDIKSVIARDHSTMAGLQLADVTASAFNSAVDPNFYGLCEGRYARLLKPKVYNRNGRYIGYGIKHLPSLDKMNLNQEQREFFESYS